MTVTPPERNDAASKDSYPWWALIGPGLAAVIGMFMLTVLFYGSDRLTPVQLELGLSDRAFLVNGIAVYLVAAAIAFPFGLWLGARSVLAVALPAVGVMLVGVLLNAFVSGAGMLLAGRLVSGLGAGATVGVTFAVVRRMNGRRGIAAAVVTVLGVLAAVAAPFVNQAIAGSLGFRWTFFAAVPLLFVALIVNVVSGIVLVAMKSRRARSGPYRMPHPSPGPPR